MVLSKGTKIVIILVAAVAVIVGAYVAIHTSMVNAERINGAARELLGSNGTESSRDSMRAGEGPYGKLYLENKNKEAFQKALAKEMQALVDEGEETKVYKAAAVLEEEGIRSEEIRSIVQAQLNATKEKAFLNGGLGNLTNFFDSIEIVGSYYSEGVISPQETADICRERIEMGIQEQNFSKASLYLTIAQKYGCLELCYPKIDEFLDSALESCNIYPIGKGRGGYYDGREDGYDSRKEYWGAEGMEHIGEENYSTREYFLGDFSYVAKLHTTQTYQEMPSSDLQKQYNKEETKIYWYFREKSLTGNWNAESWQAVRDGAVYALCSEPQFDGESSCNMSSLLLFKEDALYLTADTELLTITGDFSAAMEKARQLYAERYAPGVSA